MAHAGGGSVQSTTGSRGVRISGTNAGYIIFRGSVKSTGYPRHSPVSPSPVAYPGILFGEGVSTNSVEDRGQRERGSGGGSPLVRGFGGSCNLVQEISFHIVKFSKFLVL